MAYQKKYFYQFTSIDGRVNLVEIWHNTEAVITAEDVTAAMPPFTVSLPKLDNKFQVVRGTGCEIRLLSSSNMKFFDGLYHVDPFEFMVKHYVDGLPNWYGYLNAELARESYSFLNNYEVEVTGNDGFALTERYQFLQPDGSNYSGIKSKFELLQIVFSKIGLPFSEIWISLSTTFAAFTGAANKTILHESFVDCSNFYDEDGNAATLRTVLESILAPYAGIITQILGNIYITDIHTLATGTPIVYKRFTMSTGAYVADITDSANVRDISAIGVQGTDFDIERSGGKNKQVVSYSPYPAVSSIPESISTFNDFLSSDYYWTTLKYCFYKKLYDNNVWNAYTADGFSRFEAVKDGADKILSFANFAAFPTFGESDKTYKANDTGYFYRWNGAVYVQITVPADYGGNMSIHYSYPYFATNTRLLWLKSGNTVSINPLADSSNFFFLNITGKFAITCKKDSGTYKINFSNVWLLWKIKIGNKYYNGAGWTTTASTFYTRISKQDDPDFSVLSSEQTAYPQMINLANDGEESIRILLNEPLIGDLEVELWSQFRTDSMAEYDYTFPLNVERFFIGGLKAEIVRADGSEISENDVEYVGYLDKSFKDEAEKVTLYCGTDSTGADRGKILYSDAGTYKPITQWTRGGQTFKIEELLLGSLSSNYRKGYISLTSVKMKNSIDDLNIITDTAYLGTAKLMPEEMTIDYSNNRIDCDLVEISPDVLTIEKTV